MKLRSMLLLSLLFAAAAPCGATMEPQQLAQIQQAVEDLLRQQTAGLPGRVSYTWARSKAVCPWLNAPLRKRSFRPAFACGETRT